VVKVDKLERLIKEGKEIIDQRKDKERLNLIEKIWLAEAGKELTDVKNVFAEKILERVNVRLSQNMEFPKYEVENVVALLVAEKDSLTETSSNYGKFKGYGI